MNEIQQSDVKVRTIHTIYEDGSVQDISTATVKEIIFQSPAGTTTSFTATFLTDGTDGIIYYDTLVDYLNEAGLWKTQAKIEINGGTYRSAVSSFRVNSNL